jgi:hypothetical protein
MLLIGIFLVTKPLRLERASQMECFNVDFVSIASQTRQNLSVSSALTDTTVIPSGDTAECSTGAVWPIRSAIFTKDENFHTDK